MNSLSALDSEAWSCLNPASLLEAENGAHKNSILTPPKKQFQDPLSYLRTNYSCISCPLRLSMLSEEGDSVQKLCRAGQVLAFSATSQEGQEQAGVGCQRLSATGLGATAVLQ